MEYAILTLIVAYLIGFVYTVQRSHLLKEPDINLSFGDTVKQVIFLLAGAIMALPLTPLLAKGLSVDTLTYTCIIVILSTQLSYAIVTDFTLLKLDRFSQRVAYCTALLLLALVYWSGYLGELSTFLFLAGLVFFGIFLILLLFTSMPGGDMRILMLLAPVFIIIFREYFAIAYLTVLVVTILYTLIQQKITGRKEVAIGPVMLFISLFLVTLQFALTH